MTLKYSKVDLCPICAAKLCKHTELDGVQVVHFKHKKAEVFATEMRITCMGCSTAFYVTAAEGIIDEVPSGRH